MFHATPLAHHGWLFEAGSSRLLVDPLFHERFGHTDAVELRVYPPRRFDLDALPPIDAVFLTHEHEGHFDLPSLQRLDRAIPVHLSSRSSIAMRLILAELGFTVFLASPGKPIELGELVLHPLTADQGPAVIEEWDVLPYLVTDRERHGSFFTSVDMPPTTAMFEAIRKLVPRPGLFAHTDNHSRWDFQCDFVAPSGDTTAELVKRVLASHEELASGWDVPAALLLVGGGFSFGGAQSWLNENVFPRDPQRAARALSLLLPRERVLAPLPGQRLTMERGRVVAVSEAAPFVSAAPAAEWPSRGFCGGVAWHERYTAACERCDLGDEELAALAHELSAFATHLYGRATFRNLYSLADAAPAGRKPTFAFALRTGDDGGAYVFEYEPQTCDFTAVESADPASEYLAVFECWATDLLASFRCELSPTALGFGRCRIFNASAEVFRFDIVRDLFEYSHPLRFPERYLELYRRVCAGSSRAVGFS